MNTSTDQTFANLPVASIDADPDQPRKRFDKAALNELAASISSVGLLEPVIVRPVGERFVLIAGERRWRAAAIAGLEAIPSIIRDVHGAEAFELSMIENVVRADMNPIEEAAGYSRLVDAGMTVETIAARLGKTEQSIRFAMNLLRLDGPISDLVATGQLGTWDAWHIARLSIEGQHRVIRAMRDGELTKAGSVHRFALAVYEQESSVAMFGEADVETRSQERIASTRDVKAELERAVKALEAAAKLAATADSSEELAELVKRAGRLSTKVAADLKTSTARQLAATFE